jgi:hypothetical protein
MICSQYIRTPVALLCAGAFLFAQIAVAAHACAAVATTEASGAAVAMQAGDDEAPCGEMNVGQRTVCFRHCQDGQGTLDHQSPSQSFVATLVYYVERPLRPVVFSSATRSYSHALLARETAPPLSVRNCCLRT